jgi:hypothetical protein
MDHEGVHEVWLCHQLAFRATDTPEKNTRPKSNGLRELHKQSSQIDNQILADLWFEIRAQR